MSSEKIRLRFYVDEDHDFIADREWIEEMGGIGPAMKYLYEEEGYFWSEKLVFESAEVIKAGTNRINRGAEQMTDWKFPSKGELPEADEWYLVVKRWAQGLEPFIVMHEWVNGSWDTDDPDDTILAWRELPELPPLPEEK